MLDVAVAEQDLQAASSEVDHTFEDQPQVEQDEDDAYWNAVDDIGGLDGVEFEMLDNSATQASEL